VRSLADDTALKHLSLNTATVRKQGDLLAIIEAAKRHGISCISPWRDQVEAVGCSTASSGRFREAACGFPAIAVVECSQQMPRIDRR
jgi:hypothetical protein